jgi:hypothetical protein
MKGLMIINQIDGVPPSGISTAIQPVRPRRK